MTSLRGYALWTPAIFHTVDRAGLFALLISLSADFPFRPPPQEL
jgi:hypothetical protein